MSNKIKDAELAAVLLDTLTALVAISHMTIEQAATNPTANSARLMEKLGTSLEAALEGMRNYAKGE